ncbi:MAG: DUF6249 domain-containing protein [Pseudomonadota bacterium]
MNEEIFIPISMFIGLAIVIGMFIVYRNRHRESQQQTIRAAIDKGQDLTPELIKQIGAPPEPPKDRDLRRALLAIAIGAAVFVFGFVIPDGDEAAKVMGGLAAFPTFIGLAYLAMYFLGTKQK